MILVALCLLATYLILLLAGVTMLARATVQAPEGFEDAQGFHTLGPVQEPGGKLPHLVEMSVPVHASLHAL